MSEPSSHRRWGAVVLSAVILTAVVSLAWSRALAVRAESTDLDRLCISYFRMTETLRSNPIAQSERVRAASELVDLAERFPEVQQPNAPSVAEIPRRVRTVLRARYASIGDLFKAARAVAVACDADWRSGQPVDPQVGD